METLQKRQRILSILQEIQEELQKNPTGISDRVYTTLDALCKVGYAWSTRNNSKGWTKPLRLFSPSEADLVESRFQDFVQTGGGPKEDAEFQKEYGIFQGLLKGIQTQWNEIQKSLGIVAAEHLQDLGFEDASLSPTNLKSKLSTNKELQQKTSPLVFSFFSTVLELLRLWVAYSSINSTTYRILLSFSQLILDTVRGQVRQAIFSFVGLFGQNGFYLSILLRFLLNSIETISPGLRLQMEFDMYRNLKTMTAAVLLWSFYTFAPLTLKHQVNSILEDVKKIAKDQEIDLKELATKIQESADQTQVVLPEVPFSDVPSYDDLLILGNLLKQPDIACLPSFQKLIRPLRSIFPLRFTLELFGLPTGQLEFQELCSTKRTGTRKSTASDSTKSKQKRGAKTRRIMT